MFVYNLILLVSVIFSQYFIKQASSLSAEGIANGINAPQVNFTYQAAILGRRDRGALFELLGSGTLVSWNWLLCAAQSFMENSNTLKNYIFTASVSYSNLHDRTPESEQLIVEVRTRAYNNEANQNDIVMARTELFLNVLPNLRLSLAHRPRLRELFIGQTGTVSGFGDSDTVRTDLQLRYVSVKVKHASSCVADFPETYIHEDKHFCGLTSNRENQLSTGVCANDIGSPLIIGNKIAGLVTRTHANCNDSYRGALYTAVSIHIHFINNVINNRQINGVVVHPTRRFN